MEPSEVAKHAASVTGGLPEWLQTAISAVAFIGVSVVTWIGYYRKSRGSEQDRKITQVPATESTSIAVLEILIDIHGILLTQVKQTESLLAASDRREKAAERIDHSMRELAFAILDLARQRRSR